MDRIFKLDIKIIFIIFVTLDLFCVAMGMGVPIFCILFGFPIGTYSAKRVINGEKIIKISCKTFRIIVVDKNINNFILKNEEGRSKMNIRSSF